ncbi:MAG: transposase [Thermodesulfobacteriota bacterium]|nr:transposase [Thermodesulfobacteriota bacterium]
MYTATVTAINPHDRTVSGVYKPRNPAASHYFQCVSAHWEELEPAWDIYYQRQYGFFRPYVKEVMLRFLDCGDLHNGFARVRCQDCGHEYILAFSCKRRQFCPSCHQKRVVEFGEWLCTDVLKSVPHRQWVFSLPKRLRPWFLHDRKLLAGLSKCTWKILGQYLRHSVPYDNAVAGGVVAVQTFGTFQNFHPHLHIIATDGCFYGEGKFQKANRPCPADLEPLFRQEVFKLLKAHGLPDRVIENMMGWHHSGFNVYCGPAIWPANDTGLENLARYIIRAAFSQERMTYIPASNSSDGQAKVIYQAKDGRERKVFPALDWLAQLTTHIPNRREHMVRYYGYYSNKSRGQRKKADQDDAIVNIIETGLPNKAFRKSWARLIQKIYETDPLLCPKCQGQMKIISFIEELPVIKQIMQHLGLWEIRNTGPPQKTHLNVVRELTYQPVPDQAPADDGFFSQVPDYGYWAD